jgi:hypothetical protein
MITGFIIAAIGIGITFYTGNGLYTILGIMIFAIGEMMTNPTFNLIAAKDIIGVETKFLAITTSLSWAANMVAASLANIEPANLQS